jgi:hypothetical protein
MDARIALVVMIISLPGCEIHEYSRNDGFGGYEYGYWEYRGSGFGYYDDRPNHRSYDQRRFDGYNSDVGRHWDRDGQDGRIDRGDQGGGSNRIKSWNSDGSSRSDSGSNGPKARTQNGPKRTFGIEMN